MPSYDFSKYKLARVEWKIFSPSSSLSFFYLCSFSVVFAPKRVSHPNFITFKKKVLNLEPQISPYFTKTGFTSIDTKSRPHLQPKLTRLRQLHSEYSQFTTRTKRIHYLKRLLQEKVKNTKFIYFLSILCVSLTGCSWCFACGSGK
ncbi:PREDICTED: uncharacterized protein LOC107338358 isoform X1 [Acropora digitifera]|uniref:uncharacterized protein LOC107338358 isoform X1 n=1 Tax=Acropora digitifera TaxID=70779 RepID=UPI00077A502E|nr:PREDICTED: uncharacterized protein LOC107338358 isoform X1 [Acropora digitifera]